MVIKNPSDFVGNVLGQSESNTKGILASTTGKVLIIDEAYSLYSGNDGTGNRSDSFKTAVIDTIVAEVQSVPGEDRCVLLLGYEEELKRMFQNVNPGLSRRLDYFHTSVRKALYAHYVLGSPLKMLSALRILQIASS